MTGMFASPRRLYVNGAALWAPLLPGWPLAREILAGRMAAPATPLGRPAPELLPPNERRRAPDTVAVALEAALAACKCADLEPATLACVFSSTHGDLTITDYMCATLASTPAQLSPTRFHNSVHNAAAGYWTIAAECTRPYTALSAGEHTFGAGAARSQRAGVEHRREHPAGDVRHRRARTAGGDGPQQRAVVRRAGTGAGARKPRARTLRSLPDLS